MSDLYKCLNCGNIIDVIKSKDEIIMCCGNKMQKIISNTVDASKEKHLPIYTKEENLINVIVGSEKHPMNENHYIEWVQLETTQGIQRKFLKPNTDPKVVFSILDNEQIISIYAYCNLHGLWKI